MKKFLSLTILILASASVGLAQKTDSVKMTTQSETGKTSKIGERKSFELDNNSTFDANGRMTRGAGVSRKAKLVSLAEVFKAPGNFAGKTVAVKGVIVRSCKKEGCWMELAPSKDAKSVRVTFKNHAFFIPLDAAGSTARAEGVFTVKTLSKAEVEHLTKEDGAKIENVNKDGTATEISFVANGVELTKQKK
ncbi:MAG: DUF4920 domain-containing protein [Acidobacteria bacterium]|jgi:hypothetical protein|nr:DUF4920 domain-containing protein [Acidobacteriota bacterium]